VDNAYNAGIAPLTADYTFDGGLYRDVGLWAVDPLAVTLLDNAGPGVYLRQRDVSSTSATVGVTTKVVNNSRVGRLLVVRAVITDDAGMVVAEESTPAQNVAASSGITTVQTLTVADPHRWNGLTDPYLYRATIEIHDVAAHRVTDVVTQPLGLRRIDLNPSTGFFLNDHHLPLHGVNLHQDRAGVGWAVTSAGRVQDSRLIKEVGANAVRMAHYQHDQQDYDLADAQGIVVWAEIPLIEDVPGSAAYKASTEQQLRELITQNYNHPSIAFWSIGNEQIHDDAPTNALLGALARIAHAMDPERLSAYANCCGRAAEVVEQVGLGDAAHRRASGLSLGMAQRLGIAAMLVGDPRTLILDEPLNGLDPEGIVWIRTLLKDLAAEERTVFVSSHLLSEMALTAEHLIVISRGTLVADTSVAEFVQRASPARVRVRTPQAAELGELLAGPAVTIVNLPDGLLDVSGLTSDQIGQAASRHFITLLELTVRHPSLEEAFRELTKESTGDPHGPRSAAADALARATPDGARRPR
jgi:ABC-type dipeptide/oligopeptide/nickel transport system ATPase subunit